MSRKYTAEQIAFIADNIKGLSYEEMATLFNEHFGMNLPVAKVMALISRNGLKNGIDCRLKQGLIPWNKGKKGLNIGGQATQFKKGHIPKTYRPVGSERISVDGYVEVKVADPKTWRMKHVVIWEAAHGLVPKGHVVIFADGNKQNVSLENLLLISRRELAVMNKRSLITNDADLTKTGILVADIYLKISERKKK